MESKIPIKKRRKKKFIRVAMQRVHRIGSNTDDQAGLNFHSYGSIEHGLRVEDAYMQYDAVEQREGHEQQKERAGVAVYAG
jgi:hypothetical protein